MPSIRKFQTNLSSGEVDALMVARVDTAAVRNGAKRLRNVALLATGGATRRPGTRYTGSQLPGAVRLERWQFSVAERYVVAFADRRAVFFDYTGVQIAQLLDCPWTEAMLPTLRVTQAADTMIVVHQQLPPQIIRRTGLTSFARARLAFSESVNGDRIYQPYYKFADDKTTLTPSGETGDITLTASGPVFRAGHVGTRFRWKGVEVEIKSVVTEFQANGTVRGKLEGRYDPNPFRVTKDSNVVEVTHVAHGLTNGARVIIRGANLTGGIPADALNGERNITVIDDNTYSFVAAAVATASPDQPATDGSPTPDYLSGGSGDSAGSSDAPTGGGGGPE